jgi:hypothetical protein
MEFFSIYRGNQPSTAFGTVFSFRAVWEIFLYKRVVESLWNCGFAASGLICVTVSFLFQNAKRFSRGCFVQHSAFHFIQQSTFYEAFFSLYMTGIVLLYMLPCVLIWMVASLQMGLHSSIRLFKLSNIMVEVASLLMVWDGWFGAA